MCDFSTELNLFIDVSKKYWTYQTLINLTSINDVWYNKFSEDVDLLKIETTKEKIKNIIAFKDDIYDHFTYQRAVLKRMYNIILTQYDNLKLSYIAKTYTDDDLDDDLDVSVYLIYCIAERCLPYEYTTFLKLYAEHPDPRINILLPDIVNKYLQFNKNELTNLNLFTSSKPKDNMIFIIPICYTKHHRQNNHDINYISVLCYIHNIKDYMENEFCEKDNRYLVLHISSPNIDNQKIMLGEIEHYITKIYNSLMSVNDVNKIKEFYYPQDVFNISKTFTECLQKIIKDYRTYI